MHSFSLLVNRLLWGGDGRGSGAGSVELHFFKICGKTCHNTPSNYPCTGLDPSAQMSLFQSTELNYDPT